MSRETNVETHLISDRPQTVSDLFGGSGLGLAAARNVIGDKIEGNPLGDRQTLWQVEGKECKRSVEWLIRRVVVKTTMIYNYVLNRGPSGVRSPVDEL